MKDYVLVLGAGQLQTKAMDAIHELGYEVLAADANPKAYGIEKSDVFICVDIADPKAVLDYLIKERMDGQIAAVFTAGTDFSAQVAFISEKLGLPGIGYETGLNVTEKSRMRAIFEKHKVKSPRFITLMPNQEPRLPENAEFPFVVKPSNNMGSRGVSKIYEIGELPKAYELAFAHSKGRGVLVEEFIEGQEYSIDSLVIDGKVYEAGLAIRHIHFPPYFVELGHTMPAELSDKDKRNFMEEFQKAVSSLGIVNGVAKGDIFYGPRGTVIGEIAARLSGGFMSGWTYPLSSGYDLTRAAVEIALGRLPEKMPPHQYIKAAAERAIISIPGVIHSFTEEKSHKENYKVNEVFVRAQIGNRVLFPKNNVEKIGNVIASGEDRKSTIERAEDAVKNFEIRLVAFEPTTIAYLLRADMDEYPCAYPELSKQLEKKPNSDISLRDGKICLSIEDVSSFLDEKCVWNYMSLRELLDKLDHHIVLVPEQNLGAGFLRSCARGGIQAAQFFLDCLEVDRARTLELWKDLK